MVVALEELTAGVLESSAGPWALALGAGALAVALAVGSARPLGRIAARGVATAEWAGSLCPEAVQPGRWLRSAAGSWRALVDEARAEYEASQAQTPDAAADRVERAARRASARGGPRHAALATPRRRDERGRFVPGSQNGTSAE